MLKISGESLAGSNEQGFDFDILNDLSENIKKDNNIQSIQSSRPSLPLLLVAQIQALPGGLSPLPLSQIV